MNIPSSTLIVFELLPPYGKEVVTNLAIPDGFYLRFRFKKKWFVTDDPLKILNTEALIALRITKTAEIIPIRFCKIVDIKDIGNIFYILVQVREYAELHSGGEGQKEQIRLFNRDLRDSLFLSINNTPGRGMEKLIFNAPSFKNYFGNPSYMGSPENKAVAAWGNLVGLLIKQDEFLGLDFLCIVEFEGAGSQKTQTICNGTFVLAPEQHYVLRVMQRRSDVEPVKEIMLKLDKDVLTPILDKQLAVGAYDILEFSFRTCKSQISPQKTAIVLTNSSNGTAQSFAPIIFPVVIPGRSRLIQGISILLFITSAITLIIPNYIVGIFHQPPEIISEQVRNLLILIAIVTSREVGTFASLILNKTFSLGGIKL